MGNSDIQLCRDMFFSFVSTFGSMASAATVNFQLKLAEIHVDLLKYDRPCSWGTIKVEDDGDTDSFSLCTVAKVFPDFLSKGNIELSLFVAENIGSLFTQFAEDGTEIPEDRRVQSKAFDNLFLICNDFLEIPEKMSGAKRQDRQVNQQAACLHTLTSIISCSPICEKKCLLALAQVCHESLSKINCGFILLC